MLLITTSVPRGSLYSDGKGLGLGLYRVYHFRRGILYFVQSWVKITWG